MAVNADIRRRLNDHRRRLFDDTAGEIAFLCECADPTCTRAVVLSPADFDSFRDRAAVLLYPGHDALQVDPVQVEALQVEALQVELAEVDPFDVDPAHVDPVEVDPLAPEPPGPEPLQ